MKFMQLSVLASITAISSIIIYRPSVPQKEVIGAPVSIEYQTSKTWKCPSCSPEEKYVLKQLQEKTKIKDRNALATILGNIKQESNFRANVCEGGARVPYDSCYSGGYGIIQWTSTQRYLGLGYFARKYNCDPSSLYCQTRYMIVEPVFQKQLSSFENVGLSIDQYMKPSYRWLGWGIKGKRQVYSHQYTTKLIFL